LEKIYPKLSDAKLKYSVFVGPKILKIINNYLFEHMLTENEKSAGLTLKAVCLNFLGNLEAENYKEPVEDLLNSYQTIGCNMLPKMHFLYSHLDFFPPKLGTVSNEHGESFHQDISTMEKG
jgi:hypothetical protein